MAPKIGSPPQRALPRNYGNVTFISRDAKIFSDVEAEGVMRMTHPTHSSDSKAACCNTVFVAASCKSGG